MNSTWQSFLEGLGASIVEGEVRNYGDPASELKLALNGNTLCDLSHEALIQAKGDDSTAFLQGQLTNDVRAVSETQHQLSSYCSPKGRMLALFRLFQRGESYYLQLPQSVLEPTLKRLRMFVLMSKVELEDVSDALIHFSLSGPDVEAMLEKHLGEIPDGVDQASTQQGITLLRIAGVQPRFIVIGEHSRMQTLWQALQADGASPVGADAGRLLDIHAGLPAVWPETIEAFVPQMVNLQQVNGVSFKKGCYTGQEVVARMQYLGKLKRRMYLAHVSGDTAPVAGDTVFSPSSESGQGAGKVVTVAASPEGGYDILAVIEIASVEAGPVYLDTEHTRELGIQPLPYALEPLNTPPQVAG